MADNDDILTLVNLYEGTEVFDVPEPHQAPLSNTHKNAFKAVIVCKNASDDDMVLLRNILKAVSLSENEVLITGVESIGKPVFSNFFHQQQFSNLVSFGYEAAELDLNIRARKYEPVYVMGVQVLFSEDLARIAKDKQAKLALWTALKNMFEIKPQG